MAVRKILLAIKDRTLASPYITENKSTRQNNHTLLTSPIRNNMWVELDTPQSTFLHMFITKLWRHGS